MSTITVRLRPEEETKLDQLAGIYGDRSSAIRAGIGLLAATNARRADLAELLAEWDAEEGPIAEEAVERMAERYGL